MNTKQSVLLTGGRAPATLELARLLGSAGHRVIVAESARRHLCQHSRYVELSYQVPSPRQQSGAYIEKLCEIMHHERIDLLIPTCEEIFYVSRGRDQLLDHGEVLVEGIEVLRSLHDKWLFAEMAREVGALVPQTVRVHSSAQLREAMLQARGPVVLKPVYSRFAAHVKIVADPSSAAGQSMLSEPTVREPWLVQQFIKGKQVCSYAVAREGQLTLYADYETTHTAGQGASIYFAYSDHPQVRDFVSRFVQRHAFSGQIAFDFIENEQGELYVLECNPRLTSGVHLFAGQEEAATAYLSDRGKTIVPAGKQASMLGMAMLTYGLLGMKNGMKAKRWVSDLLSARDVLFRWEDPRPFFDQFSMLADLAWQSFRTGKSMIACSTSDIEWNGEEA
ncbi:ATP-grasp domain-containing protein [Brevibacillus sp. AF8]|uniref:ATP-grasp domain-containing protein n=1 Tax=Brevibacillus sp. AF8 TaxID=2825881 RepID=UPI001E4B2812|nr:ATP-grasp domain-containing protein [Brevibacillus sp. AF8]MCE0450288.1 ATP-grasp domain-containing protein [Brevibacillus sp. AF8]